MGTNDAKAQMQAHLWGIPKELNLPGPSRNLASQQTGRKLMGEGK